MEANRPLSAAVFVIGLASAAAAAWLSLHLVSRGYRPLPGPGASAPTAHPASNSNGTLLQRARRVAALPAGTGDLWFWLSPSALIYFRPEGAGTRLSAVRLDLGRSELRPTPLSRFNRRFGDRLRQETLAVPAPTQFRGRATEPAVTRPTVSVSPDGRWILWAPVGSAAGRWIAGSPDAARERRWPRARSMWSPLWWPDSRAWVEVVPALQARGEVRPMARAIVHPLDSAMPEREIQVLAEVAGTPVGLTADGRALFQAQRDPEEWFPEAEQIALTLAVPDRMQRSRVPLPHGALVTHVAMSPAGDRLAWLYMTRPGRDSQAPRWGVWVSDLLGRHFRALGETSVVIREVAGVETVEEGWPGTLRWLPDGRRLSFRLGGGLYVVPAP